MQIEIRELELHPVDFKEQFAPGAIDLGADCQQRAALVAEGRAQLVQEHHGKHHVIKDIRINGQLSTRVEAACARCLEPVTRAVERQFDLLYRPQGSDAGKEELSVTAADAEIGYYQGDGLLLEDVLREQVLLSLPVKTLCQEDCKGLCPQCGQNLNVELCACTQPLSDPRWSTLKSLGQKTEK
jgi:uncharacterized protein